MPARQSDQENENDLDLTVFVDFEPAEICALAECGEFSGHQFSSLMRLCSDDVARSVLEGLDDSTLQAFFVNQEDLQPLLETAIFALGAEELRRRAKQWLIKASKARAKAETVKCSNIIQAIVLHQAKRSTPSQQVSEPLPRPGPTPTQNLPSANQQERHATPRATAQPKVTLISPPIHPPTASIPSAKTGVHSHVSPPSPEQMSSAHLPSPPRVPQPFPLNASQTPEPHLPRSPKRANLPSLTSPMCQPHNALFHAGLLARPLAFNVTPPPSSAKNQGTILGGNLAPAQADLREEKPGKSSDLTTDEATSLGDQPDGHGANVSQSNNPLETEASGDLDETAQQAYDTKQTTTEPVVRVSSANPWDAATNAARVEEWKVEDAIHSDPHHTSPVHTEWMYEDRKRATGKNDKEYKALTDQEYSRFAGVPPAVREHAGRVFNKKSKFDWEIRVVLGQLAYDYSQMDEPENRKFLHNALPGIETRFPDLSPAHVFRQIDDEGPKAVQKWRSDVAKWVQTTAGKMGGTHNDLEHCVEILESKKSSKKFDANQLLGLNRATVNYVLVVGQSAEIADLHIILLASGTISGGRIPVIMKEFGVKANQGPFLDANDVGGRAKAEYPNYVSHRFQADPSELVVLDHGGEDNLDFTGEQPIASKSKNTNKGKGKGKGKANDPGTTRLQAQGEPGGSSQESHPALSQWKPSAAVNTDAKRAEYMNRFFTKTFNLNFPCKIPWNKVSSENNRYLDPWRRPQDSTGQPIQLVNPLGMPVDTQLNPWWDFMQACARGRVSAERIFCWKPETTRLALPSIPILADPDVHMAGELSRTANPGKRPRVPPKSGRKKVDPRSGARSLSDEPEMDLEIDMESEEEVNETMEDEPRSPRVLRNRPVLRTSSAANLNPSNSGDEEELGTSGSEFEPAGGQSRARGSASMSRPSARGLDEHGVTSSQQKTLRVPSLEAEEADKSTPESGFSPKSSSPANCARPQSPPLAPVEAAPQSISSLSAGVSDASSNFITSANAIPASSSANVIPASSSANIIPASSSANFIPTSASESPSKESESIISPTNAILSPTTPIPFMELQLVHPQMFSREAAASGSPAWLQVKPLWEAWGRKVAFLNIEPHCDIYLSSECPKAAVNLPSALTSAVSIAQIFLALQLLDPHKPNTPPVQVPPTCHLDDLHPHHHLRQVVEGILDVKTPLPSAKTFESNMLLNIEALDAFFGSLKVSLELFIDDLTSSEQTLRYAEVEFFTSLRLALFIKGTTFMRDEGDPGPSLKRVNSLMDCLVSVLAGIAVLRYMQEYLGGALARWTREDSDKSSTRWEMWYTFLQLWKAGMSGLASALSQGRKDLFQYRAIGTIISPSVKSIVDHLMANPAWWSPQGDGVPVAFCVGLKQFVPSEALFKQLHHIRWSRLSFLDRASVLLLLFICAIQISQEPSFSTRLLPSTEEDPASLVSLFIASCRDLRVVIEGSIGTEEGPKYSPDASENEVRRRKMIEGWIKVWQSERGPGSPAEPEGTPIIPPSGRASVRITQEVPEPRDLDEPEIVTGVREVDSMPEAAPESASIQEEDGVQHAAEQEGDLEADIAEVAGKKRKRKVPVGGRRIAGPSVGLAENPRQRLKEVAAKASEQETEERPRRKAYLNSPYVSAAQLSQTNQMPHLEAKQESSKKPKAITAKAKAVATASAPSSSPRRLTKRQISVELARKAAQAKAAKRAAGR